MSDPFSPPATGGALILPDQALPPNLFVLPVSSATVFPGLMAPLAVTDPQWVATVEEVISRQRVLGLLLPKEGEARAGIQPDELHQVGVAVKILKRLKLPDGSVNILVHSLKRFKTTKTLSSHPHLVVEAEYLKDEIEKDVELDALTRAVVARVKRLAEINPFFNEEMRLAMVNAPTPGVVADIVAFALSLPRAESQRFLETLSVKARFEKLLTHLAREQDVADLQKKIQDDVNTKINTLQREYFLKEQLKVIKRELGMEEDGKEKSARTFRDRIEAAGMPDDVKKAALEELEKFETLNENSPDFNITRTYLETLCALPWSNETVDHLELDRAETILNEEHFGLDRVKERILEFLAVRKLQKAVGQHDEKKGSIICLVGPPGVGKTSIGKSIARTMGRSFYRFSLGGMRDEAEIKGHRRTYIGAMPGKFITAMRRAGTKNPVILLDEIDKLGASFQGDPASALLEVLDPEQNKGFLDHYLDQPFDLSQVLFVATANSLQSIPGPLLDRMEIIEISGYTLEEKEKIATKYVIPRAVKSHGLKPAQIKITKEALRRIMLDYAREPGLRVLQQLIDRIARKAASQRVRQEEKNKKPEPQVVRPDELSKWLGPVRYTNELAERITQPGVVVGLAWTSLGGDILFLEANDIPGGAGLKLTGQMGEVMTESAGIAWSYIKKKVALEKKVGSEWFKDKEVHLHIPAGAIPKDGPSAGITMASALYSLFSGRKAKAKTAMTGELSLVGKVLPVGGIKEKLLAAKRAGVTTVVLPAMNKKDVAEVPDYALEGMTLHFVSHVEEVFDLVLDSARPQNTQRVLRVAKTSKAGRGLGPKRKTKKAGSAHRTSR